MSNIVRIIPKPGSRRFKTIGNVMHNKYTEDVNGRTVERTSKYKAERFDKSRQMWRPEWSFSKKRWDFKGFDGSDPEQMEKFQELVKRCKLKYEKGHPDHPRYIEEADIYDFNDPFLTHKDFKVLAEQGNISLDKNHPFDQLILAGLMQLDEFQLGAEDNPIISGRARYLIIDDALDKQVKKENRNEKMEVYDMFKALTDDDKVKIAFAMSLINSPDMDREVIDDLLFQAAEDTSQRKDMPMSNRALFKSLCKMDPEERNIRYLVGRAKPEGILRWRSDSGYLLFGKPVAKTYDNLIEYLKDPEHGPDLMRLQEAINVKN